MRTYITAYFAKTLNYYLKAIIALIFNQAKTANFKSKKLIKC